MLFLVLGRGKTGSLVAKVAKERGHGVRVVGEEENRKASALTAPVLAGFDAIIDFTTPEAAVQNMRACLATGARMVVGTTGWYAQLDDMKALCARRGAALLYSTNFSVGVQALFKAGAGSGGGGAGVSVQHYGDASCDEEGCAFGNGVVAEADSGGSAAGRRDSD